jgi:malate dehydrogenase (oxaloacetate-decarboxylating)
MVDQSNATLAGPYVETTRSGYDLLDSPSLNKGTAFTGHERDLFDLIAPSLPR